MGGLALAMAVLFWALLTPGVGPTEAYAMDKVAHAAAFAALGATCAIAWPGRALTAFFGLAAIAVLTELAQTLVPARSGAVGDGLADMAGAALGLLAVNLFRRWHLARTEG